MMRKFEKLLEEKAKKSKKMSDVEKKAKMEAVKEIDDMATGMMADKLAGLKKVTVASPDKEGLKKGLEVAENILEEQSSKEPVEKESEEEIDSVESEDQMEDSEEKMEDSEEMEEESEESPEEKIRRLEEELLKLKKSRG